MIILIIFVVVFIICSLLIAYGIVENKYIPFFIGCVTLFTLICCIENKYSSPKPTALDVYRGKTTLQITYKDSVPIDSVVVFK